MISKGKNLLILVEERREGGINRGVSLFIVQSEETNDILEKLQRRSELLKGNRKFQEYLTLP